MSFGTARHTSYASTAAQAVPGERAAFIRMTYTHLAGAFLVFALLESALLNVPGVERLVGLLTWSWLLTLGLFMVVSFLADRWARSNVSRGMQYAGLGLYIVIEAIIFLPLMYVASSFAPGVIPAAGVLTAVLFLGLTTVVFTTGADFSFLRGALVIGSFVALGLIVASLIFGFDLGVIFSAAMIGLAGGYILYSTSAIMRDYRTDQYVAAALSLFASVALMYFYIVRLLMALRR